MSAFHSLPPIDTSLGHHHQEAEAGSQEHKPALGVPERDASGESPVKTPQPLVLGGPRRQDGYGSSYISTKHSSVNSENAHEVLEAVAAAVANALNVSPSEFPQPSRPSKATSPIGPPLGAPQASTSSDSSGQDASHSLYIAGSAHGSSESLSRPPARASGRETVSSIYSAFGNELQRLSLDQSMEVRLHEAVAVTLGLDRHDIPRDESFLDLGGSEESLVALEANCRMLGLNLRPEDALTCRTIAELETHVTPATPMIGNPSIVSPLETMSPVNTRDVGTAQPLHLGRSCNALEVLQEPDCLLDLPQESSGPYKTHVEPSTTPLSALRKVNNEAERILSSIEHVSDAAVLRPKAGPFEDTLVAFVTLANCDVGEPDDGALRLLHAYYTGPLPAIRRTVEAELQGNAEPDFWVLLERMPVDEQGNVSRRTLQTWIQNINEDVHRQILSIDTHEQVADPMTDVEKGLQKVVAKVLDIDVPAVNMGQSFARLGGTPTTAVQLVVRCKSQGISVRVEDVLGSTSLTQLAGVATSNEVVAMRGGEGSAVEFDLSPMQRLYLHTALGSYYHSDVRNRSARRLQRNGPYRFNQSVLLRVKRWTAVDDVRAAIETVVGHHSMLRTRFRPCRGSWSQFTLTEISSAYHFGHHTVGTNAEVEAVIGSAQAMIDFENGPVFAAQHFHTNDGFQMLYLLAHHLVVDVRSWQVIVDDLDELLTNGNLSSGRPSTFQEWTTQQQQRVKAMKSPQTLPFAVSAADSEYWGVKGGSNTYGNAVSTTFTLDAETTCMLEEGNQVLRTDSADLFLAALLLSFSQTFQDRKTPAIWKQEHDRDTFGGATSISETVGWFTSLCPLGLRVKPSDDILRVLCQVKDARRTVPGRGVPYFAWSMKDAESAKSFVASQTPLEIIFTYAGSVHESVTERLLEPIPIPDRSVASKMADIGPNVGRIALFEVSTLIDQGEGRFKFLYHRNTKQLGDIERWIRNYETLLRGMVGRLCKQSPELSFSDLPMMELTREGLNKLNKEVLPSLGLNVSNVEHVYPVTAVQESLLINQTLIPDSASSQTIYELNTLGKYVDAGLICSVWEQMARDHVALRTIFSDSVSEYGLYDQVILRSCSPNMLFIESEDDALSAVQSLPLAPPSKGNPWHRLVVCQSPGKTVLKLEISRALCDALSVSILFDELERAYFNQSPRRTPRLSYPEYLQCLKTTACSTEFWRGLLRHVPPCLFPNLVAQQAGEREYMNTSIDLHIPRADLKTFTSSFEVDISTVLKVAWGLVLQAYVGSDTPCFGYQISGRDLPVKYLHDAIGCFSTVLPCRLVAHATQTISQLLVEAQETHLKALHHQHVSVSNIQRALKVPGGCLFNTCLSFGYEHTLDDPSASIKFRQLKAAWGSEYDVNVHLHFHRGQLTVDIGHRNLTPEQATSIASAMGKAIRLILEVPHEQMHKVDLFSEHDHQQIIKWNSQPRMQVSKEPVHRLIARKAIEQPDIQAVCAWDGDFTYGKLDHLAMTLATYLEGAGVKSETAVPIIVDKSCWSVVAMLAVLNAGGTMVPVDAEFFRIFPAVIKSVKAKVVLASDSVQEYLEGLDCEVIFINQQTMAMLAAQPVMVDPRHTRPQQTACILYTSVSAAKNKRGISYSHGALATACLGQGPILRINASSRVMQLSSFSVDIALSEIFTTLINGGAVCIPSAKERLTGFTDAAQRMHVNWTYLTPPLSRKLQPEKLPGMAVVCFRTRYLDEDTYGPWVGKAKIMLAYGSAEACPLALSTTEVRSQVATSCIGEPFCGNFWIVNPRDSNRLMPIGAIGELVIGSPTLANGHDLGDEDDQGEANKAPRLLKTGHFVRYMDRGQIEFVGPRGKTVEMEGKSFPLADMEGKLRRCLGREMDVAVETIAFNYQDSDSTPIVAAFIELGDRLHGEGREASGEGSRELSRLDSATRQRLYLAKKVADMSLRGSVPHAIIPATFVPVKQMPLTRSLKVCRHTLQDMIMGMSKTQLLGLSEVPNPHEVQSIELKPLPLTQAEQYVRKKWAAVLGVRESVITAKDGFMSLGGDPDSAHELVVACRRQGVSLSVVDILRNVSLTELCRNVAMADLPEPSVAAAATAVTAARKRHMRQKPSKTLIENAIAPQLSCDVAAVEDAADASVLQTNYLVSNMLQNRGDMTYFTINISGEIRGSKMERACGLLVKTHAILRTVFCVSRGQVFQVVLRSYRPDYQRLSCGRRRLTTMAAKLIKQDHETRLDVRKPMTKFFFLDAGKNSMLVMRLSRAQYDEWSLPMLIRDLGRLYENAEAVKPGPGFCEVVRAAQLASESDAAHYWRALLDGARLTEMLQHRKPCGPRPNPTTLQHQIPTASLQSLGIPFGTILKGAWAIVLSNLSGSDDIVFGHYVEGKHLNLADGQAASKAVGPSGNIIPVRIRIPDMPVAPFSWFRSIQDQHVAGIPHETMQLSDMVKQCTSWPAHTSFSSVVSYVNQTQSERARLSLFPIGSTNCRLSSFESDHLHTDLYVRATEFDSSHCDLSVSFCERDMHGSVAAEMLNMLVSTIGLLTSAFVMEPMKLKEVNGGRLTDLKIPLRSLSPELHLAPPVQSVAPDHASTVHTIVSAAWEQVLGTDNIRAVPDVRSVPFYDIWGSLFAAAELARFYTERAPKLGLPGLGLAVFTVEEMMDHPTMMKQMELILSKHQTSTPKNSAVSTVKSHKKSHSWGNRIRQLGSNPTAATAAPPGSAPGLRAPSSRLAGRAGDRISSDESLTEGSSISDPDEPSTAPLSRKKLGRMGLDVETPAKRMSAAEMKKRASGMFGKMKLVPAPAGTGLM